MLKHFINILFIYTCSFHLNADVKPNAFFTSNMVIQRNSQATIWGTADSGEKIKVNTSWGEVVSTTANYSGNWFVRITTPSAGGPHKITFKGKNTYVIKNVLSGDLWLCGGQSNMSWPLEKTTDARIDIPKAEYPHIRQFKVFNLPSSPSPFPKKSVSGIWMQCAPKIAGEFTAVGFYFAKKIYERTKVPIGILNINWPGSRIEPWIPNTSNSKTSPNEKGNRRSPGHLYNGLIHPITSASIKGFLWYQGESNGSEGHSYYLKMKNLISGWRKAFRNDFLPFYFVQLANHQKPNLTNPKGGDGWAKLRQAQLDCLGIPHTGMSVTIDIGGQDIHPSNKKDVGYRLANWALKNDSHQNIVESGPIFRKMTIEESKAIIHFHYTGSGLMIGRKTGTQKVIEEKASKLKWFSIRDSKGNWFWADARIHNNTVIVSSHQVNKPTAVRYAYTWNPQGCNLYNKEGLPASPFTTLKE